jgi:ribulose-phosphate 3-epimerase
MLEYPELFIESFIEAGADCISIHVECKAPILETLKRIKKMGKKAGLAINPETPIEMALPYLNDIDLVLVMGVRPGFCGQKFIEKSLKKIENLRKYNASVKIGIDGGINIETARYCVSKGADVIVVGSSFFNAKDPREFVRQITHE